MRNLLTALVVAGSLFSGATYAQDNADEPNEANMIEERYHNISGQRCWDVAICHVNCFYEEDGSEDCFAGCTEDVSDSAITHWGGIADCSSENSCQTHPQDFSGEAIDCINQNCDPQLGACWHDLGQNDVGEDELCHEGEQLLGTDFVSGDPCTEQHGSEGRESCNDPEYCGDPENCGACVYDEESDHCFTGDADQNASNEQIVAYCLVEAVACAEPLAAADASESARNDALAEKQSCETDKASIEAAKIAAVAEKTAAVADKARCATELSASLTAKTDALAANQSCETDKASIEARCATELSASQAATTNAIAAKESCEVKKAEAAAKSLDTTTHYLKIEGSIGTPTPLTSCKDGELSVPPTLSSDRVCQPKPEVCDVVTDVEAGGNDCVTDNQCSQLGGELVEGRWGVECTINASGDASLASCLGSICNLETAVETAPHCPYTWGGQRGGTCTIETSQSLVNKSPCLDLSQAELEAQLSDTSSACYTAMMGLVENTCWATVDVSTCRQVATGTLCDVQTPRCTAPAIAATCRACDAQAVMPGAATPNHVDPSSNGSSSGKSYCGNGTSWNGSVCVADHIYGPLGAYEIFPDGRAYIYSNGTWYYSADRVGELMQKVAWDQIGR